MPKIIINEIDNTKSGVEIRTDFAVVVPGFIADRDAVTISGDEKYPKASEVFDENGIALFTSVEDFEKKIGLTSLGLEPSQAKGITGTAIKSKHYGNQIAYELLKLGYVVLYKNMTYLGVSDASEVTDENFKDVLTNTIESLDWWKPLIDERSSYDFRYIVTGLLNGNTAANNAIAQVAEYSATNKGRGDCIALLDIDEDLYTTTEAIKSTKSKVEAIQKAASALTAAGKASALFAPSVCYKNYQLSDSVAKAYRNNTKFPLSFHYLACAKEAQEKGFAEWYATSGMTRGLSSKYIIDSTSIKLGEAALNMLQPRTGDNWAKNEPKSRSEEASKLLPAKAVNICLHIRKGYYIWGNRTAELIKTTSDNINTGLIASHFLNIRQLCTTLNKQIYAVCQSFSFDPNSDVLWTNVTDALTPMLDKMKADQGIEDYKITRVATTIKGTFKALLRIVPIEAVEDFYFSIALEDSIDGATLAVEEIQ